LHISSEGPVADGGTANAEASYGRRRKRSSCIRLFTRLAMPTTVACDSVAEAAVSQEGEIQSPFVAGVKSATAVDVTKREVVASG